MGKSRVSCSFLLAGYYFNYIWFLCLTVSDISYEEVSFFMLKLGSCIGTQIRPHFHQSLQRFVPIPTHHCKNTSHHCCYRWESIFDECVSYTWMLKLMYYFTLPWEWEDHLLTFFFISLIYCLVAVCQPLIKYLLTYLMWFERSCWPILLLSLQYNASSFPHFFASPQESCNIWSVAWINWVSRLTLLLPPLPFS